MCKEELAAGPGDAQSGAYIAIATLLQMCLEEQTLNLAATGLLLGLDLVQGELECVAGGQPGFELGELEGASPAVLVSRQHAGYALAVDSQQRRNPAL